MFKKIVFILDDEQAIAGIETLADELSMYGIEIHIIGLPIRSSNSKSVSAWFVSEIMNCPSPELTDYFTTELKAENTPTLYITDNPLYHKYLRDYSLPVIVYLHDNNRDKNFSYAEYAIENIDEIEYESLKLAYQRLTGQPWTILETERCIIRESTVADVDSFYEIYAEPSITQYMENLYPDKDEEIAYIKDYIKNVYAFYGYGLWTILDKTCKKVIGRAGINWREGFDIPELGFVIAVPFQRQGYAYEICNAIIEYGHKELGFTAFQVLIMEENKISKALCEKLGFAYVEKVLLDSIQYDRMILCKQ
ncbi:MAG: GNAT family N-acetyltransferase [Lachnospiraceae bacterium]|nr:GNAT family N-acetyltransferase [Lachnospiraceae bacterium]